MSKKQANALFQALCEHMDTSVREQAKRTFTVEDTFILSMNDILSSFVYSEELEAFFICSYLAPLPEHKEQRNQMVRELLEGCYYWTGVGASETADGNLGLDEDSALVCLNLKVPVERTTPEQFLDLIAKHNRMACYWKDRLQNT